VIAASQASLTVSINVYGGELSSAPISAILSDVRYAVYAFTFVTIT